MVRSSNKLFRKNTVFGIHRFSSNFELGQSFLINEKSIDLAVEGIAKLRNENSFRIQMRILFKTLFFLKIYFFLNCLFYTVVITLSQVVLYKTNFPHNSKLTLKL